ncbi:hypothetical protein ACFOWE_18975 [Planomonospora corallina]|uniref:Uncharacterized protein n=1 Tax=Planomonospora corallina TaxID=1806052 RepID=A0ABV8I8L0_9ACTN
MIRRLFYMSLGAFCALWARRRLAELHPDHLARRAARGAAGLLAEARDAAAEALDDAAVRESELRSRFGLDRLEDIYNYDVKDGR